jgi:hypothetical protein
MSLKSSLSSIIALVFVTVQIVTACSMPAGNATPTPDLQATINAAIQATGPVAAPTSTPDIQATVNAAIQATNTAGQAVQATVDTAVSATVMAIPPTATTVPSADYYALTEEELAALIDQSVAQAVVASEQTTASTTQATSDGTVIDSEVETIEVYLAGVEQALAYADELIGVYYDLYGEYATESITVLTEIEQDLEVIAQSTAQTAAILEQGSQAASAAIEQLNQAAQNASTTIDQIQVESQGWSQKLRTEIEDRAAALQNLQPTEITSDQIGALQQVYEYLDALKVALGDKKISPGELSQITQLGVNANASLNLQNGPKLQGISGKINGLNNQLARGQWSLTSRDLGRLEASLPSRPPKRPGRP